MGVLSQPLAEGVVCEDRKDQTTTRGGKTRTATANLRLLPPHPTPPGLQPFVFPEQHHPPKKGILPESCTTPSHLLLPWASPKCMSSPCRSFAATSGRPKNLHGAISLRGEFFASETQRSKLSSCSGALLSDTFHVCRYWNAEDALS